jgi:Flp pilus assembly protein CpaB
MRLRRLRRHPLGFWLITFLLAASVYGAVARADASAAAASRRWGRVEAVAVVRRPVAAGAVVGAADVGVVVMPGRLVPLGAVLSVDAAVGREALVALSPGEVVLRRRLAPDGLTGPAALVPPGWRAVAVPVSSDAAALRLAVGDAVDVLATFPTDPAAGDPTVVVAAGALVVDARPDAVTLAVPPATAPRLAYALARATLTLTLAPPPSPSPPPSISSRSTADSELQGGR